jgi:hypothetical protein
MVAVRVSESPGADEVSRNRHIFGQTSVGQVKRLYPADTFNDLPANTKGNNCGHNGTSSFDFQPVGILSTASV